MEIKKIKEQNLWVVAYLALIVLTSSYRWDIGWALWRWFGADQPTQEVLKTDSTDAREHIDMEVVSSNISLIQNHGICAGSLNAKEIAFKADSIRTKEATK